ncbi:MAG: type I restriction-modification system subunit M N-terminal domain-containing protein [Thermoplasmatota archaeon]
MNQNEINAVAWKACDTFRGVIDPSKYKNYILVFLFIKYLSDHWRDKYQQYEEKYGRDQQKIKHMMRFESFQLPDGCSYYDIYKQRNADNIGEIINIALEQCQRTCLLQIASRR